MRAPSSAASGARLRRRCRPGAGSVTVRRQQRVRFSGVDESPEKVGDRALDARVRGTRAAPRSARSAASARLNRRSARAPCVRPGPTPRSATALRRRVRARSPASKMKAFGPAAAPLRLTARAGARDISTTSTSARRQASTARTPSSEMAPRRRAAATPRRRAACRPGRGTAPRSPTPARRALLAAPGRLVSGAQQQLRTKSSGPRARGAAERRKHRVGHRARARAAAGGVLWCSSRSTCAMPRDRPAPHVEQHRDLDAVAGREGSASSSRAARRPRRRAAGARRASSG